MAKEFCFKISLNVEGNFYIKANSKEEAEQIIKNTPFLNEDLTNNYFTTTYNKEIKELRK